MLLPSQIGLPHALPPSLVPLQAAVDREAVLSKLAECTIFTVCHMSTALSCACHMAMVPWTPRSLPAPWGLAI